MGSDGLTPVLHLVNGEHYAGAERVQDLLAQRLPDFGYRALFGVLKPGAFIDARQSQEVPLFPLPMRGRGDLRPVWRVRELVRREGVRLIHTHTPRSALVGRLASLATGTPMVHHVHSETAQDTGRRVADAVNARLEQLSIRSLPGVIACSSNTGQYARTLGVPGDRLTVVTNGVPSWGMPAERQRPVACWTLGTVALFRARKGIEILLEALARVRAGGHEVRLRAVGGFETAGYECEIRALADRLDVSDAVEWAPFTTDVAAELARMDLYVLPSLAGEGLPMAVLEAMAAGLPVVGTSVGGVPDAVRHGRDGLIVPPGDAAAFAAAIEEIVSGKRDWDAMRRNALEQHQANFSDRSMAERVARVYDAVLERAAPVRS